MGKGTSVLSSPLSQVLRQTAACQIPAAVQASCSTHLGPAAALCLQRNRRSHGRQRPVCCGARNRKVDDLLLGLWLALGLSRVSSLLLAHQTPLVSMPPAQRQVPLLCLRVCRDKVQRLSAFGDWEAESPKVGSTSAFFS